jgi:RNA polymerase sigma factor (sigma-70 family)
VRLPGQSNDPPDDVLIGRVRAGREEAIRALMARYDRLVRFTIFRAARRQCLRDPEWLDGLASEVWTGFVRAIERGAAPPAARVTAYLIQIARNKCVDAARRLSGEAAADRDDEHAASAGTTGDDDPAAALARVEDLTRLRECVASLDPESRRLCGEIAAIMDRRWQEAAGRLGMSESTLRSKWQGVMTKLRRAMG